MREQSRTPFRASPSSFRVLRQGARRGALLFRASSALSHPATQGTRCPERTCPIQTSTDRGQSTDLRTPACSPLGPRRVTHVADFDLSGALRRIRRIADMSQRELAAACGLSQSAVARVENGRGDLVVGELCRAAAVADLRLALLDPAGEAVAEMSRPALVHVRPAPLHPGLLARPPRDAGGPPVAAARRLTGCTSRGAASSGPGTQAGGRAGPPARAVGVHLPSAVRRAGRPHEQAGARATVHV
jgi:transcriptional regulator with XRE-family HTH domain